MKTLHKAILAIAVIALVGLAVFLLADRMMPKSFSDLCPDADRLESCQIIYVTIDENKAVTLTGDDLDDLLSVLKSAEYSKQGSYDSVMEGHIFHLFFSSQGKEMFRMEISDMGKVYIGAWCYEINPNIISSYLETVLR